MRTRSQIEAAAAPVNSPPRRKPIFTVLAFVAPAFGCLAMSAVLSKPPPVPESEAIRDFMNSMGRAAGAGLFWTLIGLVFAVIGLLRRERYRLCTWTLLVIDSAPLLLGVGIYVITHI